MGILGWFALMVGAFFTAMSLVLVCVGLYVCRWVRRTMNDDGKRMGEWLGSWIVQRDQGFREQALKAMYLYLAEKSKARARPVRVQVRSAAAGRES